MKKRLLSVFVFLAIFSFNCIGQQQIPIKNVPSPEIAGLGEYGKVPVSLYTGVPDISVPIYELKAGNYSLSLAASYHLASVEPNTLITKIKRKKRKQKQTIILIHRYL